MPLLLALLFSNSVAASSSSKEPCDEDNLECLHKLVLDQAIQIEGLGEKLAIILERVKTSEDLIKVYKEATKDAMAALRPAAWYQSPVLWLSMGVVVAGTLVVALVYVLAPAFQLH